MSALLRPGHTAGVDFSVGGRHRVIPRSQFSDTAFHQFLDVHRSPILSTFYSNNEQGMPLQTCLYPALHSTHARWFPSGKLCLGGMGRRPGFPRRDQGKPLAAVLMFSRIPGITRYRWVAVLIMHMPSGTAPSMTLMSSASIKGISTPFPAVPAAVSAASPVSPRTNDAAPMTNLVTN